MVVGSADGEAFRCGPAAEEQGGTAKSISINVLYSAPLSGALAFGSTPCEVEIAIQRDDGCRHRRASIEA